MSQIDCALAWPDPQHGVRLASHCGFLILKLRAQGREGTENRSPTIPHEPDSAGASNPALRSRELIERTSGLAQKLIPASTNPSCKTPRATRQCSSIEDIFAPIHSQALRTLSSSDGNRGFCATMQIEKHGKLEKR